MPFESVTIGETCEINSMVGVVNRWLKVSVVYKIGEGEDENIAADKIKAFVEEKQKQYIPELQSCVDSQIAPRTNNSSGIRESDEENKRLFEEAKSKIIAAKTKESAGQILIDSGFRLNVELKNLVNSKI